MNAWTVTSGITVAAIALTLGAAHAAVEQRTGFAAKIDACARLPLSERGICKQQALAESNAANLAPAPLSNAQRHVLNREDARYRAALAACARMPLSMQTTCVSDAGRDATLAPAG